VTCKGSLVSVQPGIVSSCCGVAAMSLASVEFCSLAEGAQVCAQVLFCCRPPTRQQGAAAETSELLQL
jgi:hypothetical protein